MAAKKKTTFDIAAFINGVERPTKDLTLCFDADVRRRIDDLTRALLESASDDESLAGDPRRESIRAELQAISDDRSAWTTVTIKAPTYRSRTGLQLALADEANAGQPLERVRDVYAALFVDCIVAFNGNEVHLTTDQARQMLDQWPDELAREIVFAIDDMGTSVASIPLSQRLSATLTTPEPVES